MNPNTLIIEISEAIKKKNYSRLYDLIAEPNGDINQTGINQWTPLLTAVDLCDVNLTRIFLKMGANPNSAVSATRAIPALDIAITNTMKQPQLAGNYKQIIALLLEHGAREFICNRTGQTTLHLAAESGWMECVELLLQYGFDAAIKNYEGKTPGDLAKKHNHTEISRKLASFSDYFSLDKIAEAGVIDKKNLVTYSSLVLDNQMAPQRKLPKEIMNKIKYFAFYNPAVTPMPCYGTPNEIFSAVNESNTEKLEHALKNGHVIEDSRQHNTIDTPLEVAVTKDNPSLVSILLKHGSIVSSRAFEKCASDKMKAMLLTEKIKQLMILKEELDLMDKNPSVCKLQ